MDDEVDEAEVMEPSDSESEMEDECEEEVRDVERPAVKALTGIGSSCEPLLEGCCVGGWAGLRFRRGSVVDKGGGCTEPGDLDAVTAVLNYIKFKPSNSVKD